MFYLVIIDIHVMLFAGFGFLMTFLQRYGYSAISFTIIITAIVTEFAILLIGFTRLHSAYLVKRNREIRFCGWWWVAGLGDKFNYASRQNCNIFVDSKL